MPSFGSQTRGNDEIWLPLDGSSSVTPKNDGALYGSGRRKPKAQSAVWTVLLDSLVSVNVPPASLRKVAVERESKCSVPRAVRLGVDAAPRGCSVSIVPDGAGLWPAHHRCAERVDGQKMPLAHSQWSVIRREVPT
jgi:hypothetical protein